MTKKRFILGGIILYIILAGVEQFSIRIYDIKKIGDNQIFQSFLERNPNLYRDVRGREICEVVSSSLLYQTMICAEGYISSPKCELSDFTIKYVGPERLLSPSFGASEDRVAIYGKNIWQVDANDSVCIDYRGANIK